MPNRPYPPSTKENSSALSSRLQRTMEPSAFIKRRDSTVEAIGGQLCCQPWQLTLMEPPTLKLLFDCMMATEQPRESRYGMISDQRAPAPTRKIRLPESSSIWLKGSMLSTMPSG